MRRSWRISGADGGGPETIPGTHRTTKVAV